MATVSHESEILVVDRNAFSSYTKKKNKLQWSLPLFILRRILLSIETHLYISRNYRIFTCRVMCRINITLFM